jgi:uncharacterized membrane protein
MGLSEEGCTLSHTSPAATDPRWKLTPTKIVVAILLLVGIVVPLLVSTYDSIEPRLFGFPFFYWYQLLWVFLAAAICGVCYFLLQRESNAYRRAHPRDDADAQDNGGAAR